MTARYRTRAGALAMAVMAAAPFLALHLIFRLNEVWSYRESHWLIDLAAVVFILVWIEARFASRRDTH